MNEIKRCPFCGGVASPKVSYGHHLNKYYAIVKCLVCGASTKPFLCEYYNDDETWADESIDMAVGVWNTRAKENE